MTFLHRFQSCRKHRRADVDSVTDRAHVTLNRSHDRMLLSLPQPFLPQGTDRWRQNEKMDTERQSDVMSVCTFLPQLAQTPVEQSQDKANEYGLDRLQYGWLEGREGGREGGGEEG